MLIRDMYLNAKFEIFQSVYTKFCPIFQKRANAWDFQ